MDNILIEKYIEKIKGFLDIALVSNTNFLLFIIVASFIFLYLIFRFLIVKRRFNKETLKSKIKPSINDVINEEDENVVIKNSDNDFVDVLVAIEEEMAAVRELYVGGYITKGIYISETDRLYEKAKVFGL